MLKNILAPVVAGVIFTLLLPEYAWYAIGALLSVVLLSFCYISVKSRMNRSFASSGANSIALVAIAVVFGLSSLSILITKLVLLFVQ